MRYRTGDFDMARILMMRYLSLLITFIMVANVCAKMTATPILTWAMLGIGSIVAFTAYTSEIVKRGDPVKIPYQMLTISGFIIPPLWI